MHTQGRRVVQGVYPTHTCTHYASEPASMSFIIWPLCPISTSLQKMFLRTIYWMLSHCACGDTQSHDAQPLLAAAGDGWAWIPDMQDIGASWHQTMSQLPLSAGSRASFTLPSQCRHFTLLTARFGTSDQPCWLAEACRFDFFLFR